MIATDTIAACRAPGCGGTYELEHRPLVQRHRGALAIVDAVPIWRCPICGDDYLELATAEALDRLADAPPEVIGTAPIYRYTEELPDAPGSGR